MQQVEGQQAAFAERLQQQRMEAGDVSYGEIAARITAAREASGANPAAARIARSTVYDAFRPDRARLNRGLVLEILAALGVEGEAAREWMRSAVAPPHPAPAPSGAERPERPGWRWPGDGFAHPLEPVLLLALVVAGIGMNRFGRDLTDNLSMLVWLDTIGTALIAIRVGPWAGAGVAVGGALLGAVPDGPDYLWFTLVAVVAALLWGYGARSWGLRTPLRFLLLCCLVGVACTSVAVPIAVLVYGGEPNHGYVAVVHGLLGLGLDRLPAVTVGNLLASLGDKVLTGFAAVLLLVLIERMLRR